MLPHGIPNIFPAVAWSLSPSSATTFSKSAVHLGPLLPSGIAMPPRIAAARGRTFASQSELAVRDQQPIDEGER
jgi:hypothetical protein